MDWSSLEAELHQKNGRGAHDVGEIHIRLEARTPSNIRGFHTLRRCLLISPPTLHMGTEH